MADKEVVAEEAVTLLREILVLYGAIRIVNKEDKSFERPERVLEEARAILEVDREAVNTEDGTRLLRRDEIGDAIFKADCALHGATPEQCLANPDIRTPDYPMPLDWPCPIDVALHAYNVAICKAQRKLTAGIIRKKVNRAWIKWMRGEMSKEQLCEVVALGSYELSHRLYDKNAPYKAPGAKKVEELTRVQKNLEAQLKEYRDVKRLAG